MKYYAIFHCKNLLEKPFPFEILMKSSYWNDGNGNVSVLKTPRDVDYIRRKLNFNISEDKIDVAVIHFSGIHYVELDESEVNTENDDVRLKNFDPETNDFYIDFHVYVPKNHLLKYVHKDVYVKRDLITNQIVKAGLEYFVDNDAIIADWKDDGYPKNWGFPEKEEEKKGVLNKIKKQFKTEKTA